MLRSNIVFVEEAGHNRDVQLHINLVGLGSCGLAGWRFPVRLSQASYTFSVPLPLEFW
jgi:hypothetical protein